jgi:glycosyltransferase XagB
MKNLSNVVEKKDRCFKKDIKELEDIFKDSNNQDKIGEILKEKGYINKAQLDQALDFQKEKGGRLGWILLSLGYIKRKQFFEVVAYKSGKPFVSSYINELIKSIDRRLVKRISAIEVIRFQTIPYKVEEGILTVLTAYPGNYKTIDFLKKRFKVKNIEELIITDSDINDITKKIYKNPLSELTIMGLFNRNPEESAYKRLDKKMVALVSILVVLIATSLYIYPIYTLIALFGIIQVFYLSSIFFKLIVSIFGSKNRFKNRKGYENNYLDIKEYPVYTILVPLFNEPEEVIKNLIKSIKNIDYPENKLDVIFLFEKYDEITLNIAKKCKPPDSWRFFIVPNGTPTTKPKACNYGLYFSRGKYLVIYDAEDRPEKDQLKKALYSFMINGREYACFQAYLNYYNKDENFLTKMFTLEYTYWFDYLLSGLHYLKLPIPLGGTSNHFRTADLLKISGWDPFNVAEDADLGIRFFAEGKRVGIIESTTYEEANCKPINWIKQRSRWVKGYLQTAIVYNRHPVKMIKQIGFMKWLSFQMMITGTPLTFLINPIMWIFFIIWMTTGQGMPGLNLPEPVEIAGIISLIAGNFAMIMLNFIGAFSRKYYRLLSYSFLNPVYWMMHSISAYKALWQLISKPYYWEKTKHGISSLKYDTNN